MPSKYRAKRTEGLFKGEPCRYDSMREAVWAGDLMLLEKSGEITDLKRQVKFVLCPKDGKDRELSYVCDFTYFQGGVLVVADVKGFLTAVYRLKRRLMRHFHGIRITELR